LARERSLGAFNNDLRDALVKQIHQLGVYLNRHNQIRDIPADSLCDILIEPERRAFAREAALTYQGYFSSGVFAVEMPMPTHPIDIGVENCITPQDGNQRHWLQHDWTRSQKFARHVLESKTFYTDTNVELVNRLEEMAKEWLRVGIEYDFVAEVFMWVNRFCATGDKAHARWLLPGIVPLLKRVDAAYHPLADKLQHAKYPCGRKPVPADMVEALKHANHLIAGALMVGIVDHTEIPAEMASITMNGAPSYVHPLMPGVTCVPRLSLQIVI
jgi:hypothetical protein